MYISPSAEKALMLLLECHADEAHPMDCVREDLRMLLETNDVDYQQQILQARMLARFSDRLHKIVAAGTTLLVNKLHRLFIGTCAAAVRGQTAVVAIARALRTHPRKVHECIEAEEEQASSPWQDRLLTARQTPSNAFGEAMHAAVEEWYKAHCKAGMAENKLIQRFSTKQLHGMFCQHHDRAANFFVDGAPEWLRSQLSPEVDDFVPPISYPSFCKLAPDDVEREGWRTCCCQQCLEVDDMMERWSSIMLVMHNPDAKCMRSRDDLRHVEYCTDPECPWNGPLKHRLPYPWPQRAKNIMVDPQLLASVFADPTKRPPFLFCRGCECGDCCSDPLDIEPGGDPAFTRCYGINTGDPEHDGSPCDACGWGVKYPPCPTFANSSTTIRWKCLLTTAKNVPGYEDAEGPPQSRNLTDMLVPVISSPVVLLVALEEVMRAW